MRAAVRAGVPDYQRQEVRDRVRGQVRDKVRAGLPHRVRQQGRFHHQTLWKSYTVKKGLLFFPSPAEMSLTKVSLHGNN